MKLNTIKNEMIAARQAVANRQTPPELPGEFQGGEARLMTRTSHRLDQLEQFSDRFDWDANTALEDATEDLRQARNRNLKEGGLRLGVALTLVTISSTLMRMAHGLGPLSSTTLTLTPTMKVVSGVAAVGIFFATRMDKGAHCIVEGMENHEMMNHLEDWSQLP